MSDSIWQPIETAPSYEGWIGKSLFAKQRDWGWEIWVGQRDAGEWLHCVTEPGDNFPVCGETDKPDFWMPLPDPPALPRDHP